MHPISAFISNPVKVAVGVLLLGLFGSIAMFGMPVQLSPDVEQPTITISTTWPGASPHEIEKEIVKEQEEQLKSVQGIVKMTSNCAESQGTVTLEFRVGTDLQEALLKVNSQLQQVPQYPTDADEPVIRTTDPNANAIAWMMLGTRPATDDEIIQFSAEHPEAADRVAWVLRSSNQGLKVYRLNQLAKEFPSAKELLPNADIDVTKYKKFAEDNIEAQFERVPGVASCNVFGGEEIELQVIVNPKQLAARGLTLGDVRTALVQNNQDVSAGDFWEGKRKYFVRTISEYRSVDQVAAQIVASPDGQPVYVGDIAEVKLGYKKPGGFVRGYGISNIAINCQRETGANVMDVMEGIRETLARLNQGVLKSEGLELIQVYDETEYISSAIGLVNQNIILGSALTIIVLMIFLHMSLKALVFTPLLAASAVAALLFSPWYFLITLALILVAGFWFARGTLVVALAIPTSIVGTFLVLNLLGRSLNVISLAGLAFAVGMLVDNAVVVLENVVRFYQKGHKPFEAAKLAAIEVWGAVLASTLTTLAVFLPIIFLEGEAGQLFVDIALAISAAVGLSLIVSIVVIPTAAARMLQSKDQQSVPSRVEKGFSFIGTGFTNLIVNLNAWIQRGTLRRIIVVLTMFAIAIAGSWLLLPKVEYLPEGNRNLVISLVLIPPGYNIEQLEDMGKLVEKELEPYWNYDPETDGELDYPAIEDFFCVAFGNSVFVGVSSQEPTQAGKLIELIQSRLGTKFPGSFVVAFQTSLFAGELSGGRAIDVEITGPELEKLVGIGGQLMGQTYQFLPPGTQAQPIPGLDLSSPEVHVIPKPQQISDLGMNAIELGFTVNALVDGAYVTDYYVGADKIDLVIMGTKEHRSNTQDIESEYISTRNLSEPVRLGALADVVISSGPQQINHRERQRAITIQITPPDSISLQESIEIINSQMIAPLRDSGQLGTDYQISLSGTADKLQQTWDALKINVLLAILITYLLMAALFESWVYPMVIILSVPMGAVGGIIGLKLLGIYLTFGGGQPQALDVLTMLGFVILIGTVVNNAILIVHQSLNYMRNESMEIRPAVLESVRTRIRPIFMTTLTTVFGLSPLVFFPGAGSELYRGLGSVVLGGLIVSTLFTLFLVPTLFSLMVEFSEWVRRVIFRQETSPSLDSTVIE